MKKLLYKSVLSCFLFLAAGLSAAQDESPDANYLRLIKEYTLNADGSIDFHYAKKQKLLTYRSTSSLYGETFVVYDPTCQSLKINECYTVMANGRKIPAPANSFNEVLPGFAANAPAYNQLREMVITHTGVERNSVINLDYTLHSGKGYYPILMGNELLAEAEPVQELILRIRVPLGVKLIWRIFNTDVTPAYTTEGDYTNYTWNLKDVSAIPAEEFQASGYERCPRIIFSTSPDRKSPYTGFVSQEAFKYLVSDDMKRSVESVLGESHEKTDILLKLQDKVVNEMRLWPIPLRYTGYKCRTAEKTWQSNGGTVMEKAILLCALLREAGIAADPVLVIRHLFFDEKMGTLQDVDDILVKTELAETGPIYLSLNSMNPQNLKYNLPDKILVTLSLKDGFPSIKTEEYHNRITFQGSFVISDQEKISGEVSASFLHNSDLWLSLLRDKNKAKSFFSGGVGPGDLKDSKIATLNQEESFVSFSVQKDKPFKKDSNFCFYLLPYLNNGVESWGIRLLPKTRITSFEIPYILEENYEFTFTLPAGMKLFNPEEKIAIRNKAGVFVYEIKNETGKITVKKSINLAERVISPADYPDFKSLLDHWNSERYKQLIIEKTR